MIEFFVVIGLVSIFGIFGYRLITKKIESTRRSEVIKNFANYNVTLQLVMDKAYDIIYKDKIIYSKKSPCVTKKQIELIKKLKIKTVIIITEIIKIIDINFLLIYFQKQIYLISLRSKEIIS